MDQYELFRIHQKELLEEAERYRIISITKQQSTPRGNYLAAGLSWWGGRLIRWGNVLQERFGDSVMVENTRAMN